MILIQDGYESDDSVILIQDGGVSSSSSGASRAEDFILFEAEEGEEEEEEEEEDNDEEDGEEEGEEKEEDSGGVVWSDVEWEECVDSMFSPSSPPPSERGNVCSGDTLSPPLSPLPFKKRRIYLRIDSD